MTSEIDGPSNQSWQPPSEHPQAPESTEGTDPADGRAWERPGMPSPGEARTGASQSRAPAQGSTGPYLAQRPSFLAPKPGIIPLRPLGVMEIISGAFEALRANPRAMFLPALVVTSVIGIISAAVTFVMAQPQFSALERVQASNEPSVEEVMSSFQTTGTTLVAQSGVSLLLSLASIILTGLIIVAVSRSVLGRVATPGEVWDRVRPRIWPLIGQSLLIGLIGIVAAVVVLVVAVGLGAVVIASITGGGEWSAAGVLAAILTIFVVTIALTIAAVYFTVRLEFSSAALILENVGVWEGMRRSWRLTRGSFWRVLGILLLSLLITSTLTGIVSGAVGMLGALATLGGGLGAYSALMAGSSFISSLLQAAILPFASAVTALTYIDLRMRKEGLDVELRQAAAV